MSLEITNAVMTDVRAKARDLKRRHATLFRGYDQEDIEQDLLLHLLENATVFDSATGEAEGFVRTLLHNKGEDMRRTRNTEQEVSRRATVTLESAAGVDGNGEPLTLADVLPSRSPSVANEAAFNVDHVDDLAALPDEFRTVVEKLAHMSQGELAREMNISRSELRRKYIEPIQERLLPDQYTEGKRKRAARKTVGAESDEVSAIDCMPADIEECAFDVA